MLFSVDDGTAIISCVQFRGGNRESQEEHLDLRHCPSEGKRRHENLQLEHRLRDLLIDGRSSSSLEKCMKDLKIENHSAGSESSLTSLSHQLIKILDLRHLQEEPLCKGDVVSIHGRLSLYRNKAQIIVKYMRIL